MYFYLSSTNPNFLDRQSSYRIFFHHGSSLLEILVIYMTRFQIEPNQGLETFVEVTIYNFLKIIFDSLRGNLTLDLATFHEFSMRIGNLSYKKL